MIFGMAPVMGFLGGNWKLIALGAAVLAAYLYVNNLKTTIVTLERDYAQLETQNNTIKSALEEQNQEIAYWTQVGREQQSKLEVLRKRLVEAKKISEEEIKRILEQEVPLTCPGAIELLRNVEKLQWKE